jgi:hypothetical protein
MNADRMAAEEPTLMASIAGFDEAISSAINDRHTYRPEQVRFGHVFANILRDLPGGFIELDLTRIHDTAPAPDQDSAVKAS